MFRFLEGSYRGVYRQMALVVAVCVLTISCTSDNPEEKRGQIGFVSGFLGGVSADDPRAAIIGRDVLASGGSAADAAVAMYFTLAVTKPSAASLGGGGVCVVHERKTNKTQTLDFLAKAPTAVPASASRPSAVPGNPRGFFALHAKYGVLRWERLVSPAANLARFGFPVSRAMATDFRTVEPHVSDDTEFTRIFGRAGGGLVREGDMLRQPDLAGVLSRMVHEGPGEFYAGPSAQLFVNAVTAAGGSLTTRDLRDFKPEWRPTVSIPMGYNLIHVAPPPADGGIVAAVMLADLSQNDRFADTSAEERPHLLAEAALRAYGDRGRWLQPDGSSSLTPRQLSDPARFSGDMNDYDPNHHASPDSIASRPVARQENPSGTSFVAVDPDGNAVACGLTMNNFFGSGRIAEGTGIVLATIPNGQGRGALSLTPMVIANANNGALFFAGSATGGVAASTALADVAAYSLLGDGVLSKAMKMGRIHHGGLPDITYVEKRAGDGVIKALEARGHTVRVVDRLGLVNAFSCPKGLDEKRRNCQVFTDPRGFGLAVASDQ